MSSKSVREVLFDMQIKKYEEIKKKDTTDFIFFFKEFSEWCFSFSFF